MRYIPAYRIWLDEFQRCPYGDYDYTMKRLDDVIQMIKESGEAYYFVDCQTKMQKELLFTFAESYGIENYITAAIHGEV